MSVAIVRRMEVARVEDRFVRACVPFFPATEAADCLHAATCLHTGAVLVSNDRHFRAIRAAGLIQVLTIAEAIRRWLP